MKWVIVLILLASITGAVTVGFLHGRSARRGVIGYLQRTRPQIVEAIESYKRRHGRYPEQLTDATGLKVEFVDQYEYKSYVTNYYLKQF